MGAGVEKWGALTVTMVSHGIVYTTVLRKKAGKKLMLRQNRWHSKKSSSSLLERISKFATSLKLKGRV
jgi:hypothetical protein